jgi:hypothetical protein
MRISEILKYTDTDNYPNPYPYPYPYPVLKLNPYPYPNPHKNYLYPYPNPQLSVSEYPNPQKFGYGSRFGRVISDPFAPLTVKHNQLWGCNFLGKSREAESRAVDIPLFIPFNLETIDALKNIRQL